MYTEIIDNTKGADNAGEEYLVIQKFKDTYLYSNWENGVISGGRIEYVKIMAVVAIFLLVIACINFMNPTTARSDRRSKEISLRKVMGAHKGSISFQFFTEAFIYSTVSILVAVLLAFLLLPYFNQLVGKQLVIDFAEPFTWIFVVGLIFLVGMISGSYPAMVLPALDILSSLKGGTTTRRGSVMVRKGLVIFQFAISTLLIIGTGVIYQQLQYVLQKELGFDKENLLEVNIRPDSLQHLNTYRNELLKLPEVMDVTATTGNPMSYGRSTSSVSWEGKGADEEYEINILYTDEDVIRAMGMDIIHGREFSREYNDSSSFIINEVAADIMGFEDPLGKRLTMRGTEGNIIGVVKNFHMQNMYEPIAPLVMSCAYPAYRDHMMIRMQGDLSNAISKIGGLTTSLFPEEPFEYEFSDDVLEASYESEITASKLVNIFATISIIISCLGLFGLSSFTAEQRAKEVGVRKVLGSSVWQIVMLLSSNYAKLILIAFLISVPLGYYVMEDWLNNFEFRMSLNPWIFILAGLVSLLIGAITISFKSYQAARLNPVDTLKDE
jgi:ABC-type antimicrobial peptide transport system permease subunit